MGEVDEFLGFYGIGCKGFLDETGFAVLKGQAGMRIVMGMGRGYVNKIDIGILDKRLV